MTDVHPRELYASAMCDWREDWMYVTQQIVRLLNEQCVAIDMGLVEWRLKVAAKSATVGLTEFFEAFDDILASVDRRIQQEDTGGDFYLFRVVPRSFEYLYTDEVIAEFEEQTANEFHYD